MSAIAIKERPILFSGAMVRAILESRKTQTRRVVRPRLNSSVPLTLEPWLIDGERELDKFGCPCWIGEHPDYESGAKWFSCPYGKEGDSLWVQETWAIAPSGYVYRADTSTALGKRPPLDQGDGWNSSIHMPREASRITLEVVNVRVERLQDISEEDAIAEGVERHKDGWKCYGNCSIHADGHDTRTSATASFMSLWNSINGKTYPWDSNPWLWIVEFKQIDSAIATQKSGGVV